MKPFFTRRAIKTLMEEQAMGFILVIASIATSVLAVYGLSGLWGPQETLTFAEGGLMDYLWVLLSGGVLGLLAATAITANSYLRADELLKLETQVEWGLVKVPVPVPVPVTVPANDGATRCVSPRNGGLARAKAPATSQPSMKAADEKAAVSS
jgi:hypothetical protein